MKKRKGISLILTVALFALSAGGCGAEITQDTVESDTVKVYALVTKAEGNPYSERMAEGFQQAIDDLGGNGIVSRPEEATAEAQIAVLRDLIDQGVDSITVAANDAEALTPVLTEAREQGIMVSTVDSDVNKDARQVFVNQVSAEEVARELMDAVYEISGGSGQWAILSSTSTASNQNTWIRAMQQVMEEEKYRDLRLVDIVYGNDESEASKEMTESLLEEYPDLQVICAPTTMGLQAAASVVAEYTDSAVRVTGLGLPSDMAEYVTGDDPICPYLFLWNPIELGEMSAYVSEALVTGKITGTEGENFTVGETEQEITVTENEEGAAEVIVSSPIRFDSENIGEWAELF